MVTVETENSKRLIREELNKTTGETILGLGIRFGLMAALKMIEESENKRYNDD